MGKRIIIVLLLGILVVLAWYVLFGRNRGMEKRTLVIGKTKLAVEVADEPLEQILGLSGRSSLCALCGMVFVFRQAQIQNFWMKDMKFPLDIIFIRHHKVVEIVENVPIPQPAGEITRVRSQEPADMVLEVNAGFASARGIMIGDLVQLQ